MDAIYDLLCVASAAIIFIVIGVINHFWKEYKSVKPIGQKSIQKGSVLVCLEDIKAIFGDVLIYSGSIVKVAEPFIDDHEEVKVYKNLRKEMDQDWIRVPVKLLRLGKENEKEGYNKGIRNISMLQL